MNDRLWAQALLLPGATLFHSPAWLGSLVDAYGFKVDALVVVDYSDRVVGGLPFVLVDDLSGRRLVALPFTDACDLLSDSLESRLTLLAELQSFEIPLQLRSRHHCIVNGRQGLIVTKQARWHEIDVCVSEETVWRTLAPDAKRAIGKAQRSGIEVRPLAGGNELQEFIGLHIALRKYKYRMLAQPEVFFESIMRRFEAVKGWFPLGAFLNNRLIAGTIYLKWGDSLYYKFNASAPNTLSLRPNNLLLWAGTRLATSLGCRVLDLGPSDDDQPGLIRFKRHSGAAESELVHLRWTPQNWDDAQAVRTRKLLSEITGLMTAPEASDELTKRAGEILYRYFA